MTFVFLFKCADPACGAIFELVQWGECWVDARGHHGRVYPVGGDEPPAGDVLYAEFSLALCWACGETYLVLRSPASSERLQEQVRVHARAAPDVIVGQGQHQETCTVAEDLPLLSLDAACPCCQGTLCTGTQLLLRVKNRHEKTTRFGVPPLEDDKAPLTCPACRTHPLLFTSWLRY